MLNSLQFNCVPMFRKVTNVMKSEPVRRSPRLNLDLPLYDEIFTMNGATHSSATGQP